MENHLNVLACNLISLMHYFFVHFKFLQNQNYLLYKKRCLSIIVTHKAPRMTLNEVIVSFTVY